jgi:hypothetical protein
MPCWVLLLLLSVTALVIHSSAQLFPVSPSSSAQVAQYCKDFTLLGNCSGAQNAAQTAVWCANRNPFLIAKPPSNFPVASFVCTSELWNSSCTAVNQFYPFQITNSAGLFR